MKKQRKVANCCVCNKILVGRIDKRYCDNRCKYIHHKSARKNVLKGLEYCTKSIKRNIVVLEGLFGKQGRKISVGRDLLFKLGFHEHKFLSIKKRENRKIFKIFNFTFTINDNGVFDVYRTGGAMCICELFYKRWEVDFQTNNDDFLRGVGFVRYLI